MSPKPNPPNTKALDAEDDVRDLTDAELQRFGDSHRDENGLWCSVGHLKLIQATKWYLGQGNRPKFESLYLELRAANGGINVIGRDMLRKILNRQKRPDHYLGALERAWPEVSPGDWSVGCPTDAFPKVAGLTVHQKSVTRSEELVDRGM